MYLLFITFWESSIYIHIPLKILYSIYHFTKVLMFCALLCILATLTLEQKLAALQARLNQRKRRKPRTCFTNQQIAELERRFVFQKYLSPSDRDELSLRLGLSGAQIITWFQNRRARFRRDVEELKSDVEASSIMEPKEIQKMCKSLEI